MKPCVCKPTHSEYLERVRSKLQNKTSKLQRQQCQLVEKLQQIEQFLNSRENSSAESLSTSCGCPKSHQRTSGVPKVFTQNSDAPVKDTAISEPSTQSDLTGATTLIDSSVVTATTTTTDTSCSIFKKMFENAKCMLSLSCACPPNILPSTAPSPSDPIKPVTPAVMETQTVKSAPIETTTTTIVSTNEATTTMTPAPNDVPTKDEDKCTCGTTQTLSRKQVTITDNTPASSAFTTENELSDLCQCESDVEFTDAEDTTISQSQATEYTAGENALSTSTQKASTLTGRTSQSDFAGGPVPRVDCACQKAEMTTNATQLPHFVDTFHSTQSKSEATEIYDQKFSQTPQCASIKWVLARKAAKEAKSKPFACCQCDTYTKSITTESISVSNVPKQTEVQTDEANKDAIQEQVQTEVSAAEQVLTLNVATEPAVTATEKSASAAALLSLNVATEPVETSQRNERGISFDVPTQHISSSLTSNPTQDPSQSEELTSSPPDDAKGPIMSAGQQETTDTDLASQICSCASTIKSSKRCDLSSSYPVSSINDKSCTCSRTTKVDKEIEDGDAEVPRVPTFSEQIEITPRTKKVSSSPATCRCAENETKLSVPCSTPPNSKEGSVLSFSSADIKNMQNITELALKGKEMKNYIKDLQGREQDYQQVLKKVEISTERNNKCCCQSPVASQFQEEIDKVGKELRLENNILRSELMEMKLQLKHCLENVEGPMNLRLQTERMKVDQLQRELHLASKNMLTNQDLYTKDMNALKLQLCCACSNITELNQMNRRMKEEMAELDCLCNKLGEDLITQKVSEAETLKRLTARGKTSSMPVGEESVPTRLVDTQAAAVAQASSSKEMHSPVDLMESHIPEKTLVVGASTMPQTTAEFQPIATSSVQEVPQAHSAIIAQAPLPFDTVPSPEVPQAFIGQSPVPFVPLSAPSAIAYSVPPPSIVSAQSATAYSIPPTPYGVPPGSVLPPIMTSYPLTDPSLAAYTVPPASFSIPTAGYSVPPLMTTTPFAEPSTAAVLPEDLGTMLQAEEAFKCSSNLEVIARNLSKTLQESIPCEECAKLPEELRNAARCIKELSDLVYSRKELLKQVGSGDDKFEPPKLNDNEKLAPSRRDVSEDNFAKGYPREYSKDRAADNNSCCDCCREHQEPIKYDVGGEKDKKTVLLVPERFKEPSTSQVQVPQSKPSTQSGVGPCPIHCDETGSCGDIGVPCRRDKTVNQPEGLREKATDATPEMVSKGLSFEVSVTTSTPSHFKTTVQPTVADTYVGSDKFIAGDHAPPKASGEIPYKQRVSGNFPFNVDTKAVGLDRYSGVHVTTTVTDSGTLEVITEGPEGVIETILNYTDDGNLEVITIITEPAAEGPPVITKISGGIPPHPPGAEGPPGKIHHGITPTGPSPRPPSTPESDVVGKPRRKSGEPRRYSELSEEKFKAERDKLKQITKVASGISDGLPTPLASDTSHSKRSSDTIPSDQEKDTTLTVPPRQDQVISVKEEKVTPTEPHIAFIREGIPDETIKIKEEILLPEVTTTEPTTLDQSSRDRVPEESVGKTETSFTLTSSPEGQVDQIISAKQSVRDQGVPTLTSITEADVTFTSQSVAPVTKTSPLTLDQAVTAKESTKHEGVPSEIIHSEPLTTSEPRVYEETEPLSVTFGVPSKADVETIAVPSVAHVEVKTSEPSKSLEMPSEVPSGKPSELPSSRPSEVPSSRPSELPSSKPSKMPSSRPSEMTSKSFETPSEPQPVSVSERERVTSEFGPTSTAASVTERERKVTDYGPVPTVSSVSERERKVTDYGPVPTIASIQERSSLTGYAESDPVEEYESKYEPPAKASVAKAPSKVPTVPSTPKPSETRFPGRDSALPPSTPKRSVSRAFAKEPSVQHTPKPSVVREPTVPSTPQPSYVAMQTVLTTPKPSDKVGPEIYPMELEGEETAISDLDELGVTTTEEDQLLKRVVCTRQIADSECQSKSQKDQSCQCCECKDIGTYTTPDKETTTEEKMGRLSTAIRIVEESEKEITESEYLTITDTESVGDAALDDIKEKDVEDTLEDMSPLSKGTESTTEPGAGDIAESIELKELPDQKETGLEAVQEATTLEEEKDAQPIGVTSEEGTKDTLEEVSEVPEAQAEPTERDQQEGVPEGDGVVAEEIPKEQDIVLEKEEEEKVDISEGKRVMFKGAIVEESEPEEMAKDKLPTDSDDVASDTVEKIFDAATKLAIDEESKTATDLEVAAVAPTEKGEGVAEHKVCKSICNQPKDVNVCQSACNTGLPKKPIIKTPCKKESRPVSVQPSTTCGARKAAPASSTCSSQKAQICNSKCNSVKPPPQKSTKSDTKSPKECQSSCSKVTKGDTKNVEKDIPKTLTVDKTNIEVDESYKNVTVGLSLTFMTANGSRPSSKGGYMPPQQEVNETDDSLSTGDHSRDEHASKDKEKRTGNIRQDIRPQTAVGRSRTTNSCDQKIDEPPYLTKNKSKEHVLENSGKVNSAGERGNEIYFYNDNFGNYEDFEVVADVSSQRKARHARHCSCIACLTNRIQELAGIVEYPTVFDEKQIYQMTKVNCACINSQNARRYVEQHRSRIPISTTSQNPPKIKAPPSEHGPVPCDCKECRCEQCGDASVRALKAKLATGVKKDCCCKDLCTCATCPFDALRPKPVISPKTSTPARIQEEDEECDCDTCVCPSKGSASPQMVTKPSSEGDDGTRPSSAAASQKPSMHTHGDVPDDCDCTAPCVCPGLGKGDVPMTESAEKTPKKQPPHDCTCGPCECPGLDSIGASDTVSVATCDCEVCECTPCADPKRRRPGSEFPSGVTSSQVTSEMDAPPCDCSLCECKPCADKRKHLKVDGKPSEQKPSSAGDTGPKSGDECTCATCECFTDSEEVKHTVDKTTSIPKKVDHPPGCECPECQCLEAIIQAELVPETITTAVHALDCICTTCSCPEEEPAPMTASMHTAKSTACTCEKCTCQDCMNKPSARQVPTQRSATTQPSATIKPFCTCTACACPECAGSQAQSGPIQYTQDPPDKTCKCDKCSCDHCAYMKKPSSAGRVLTDANCKCDKCVCEDCAFLKKSAQLTQSSPGVLQSGDMSDSSCKCEQCSCEHCTYMKKKSSVIQSQQSQVKSQHSTVQAKQSAAMAKDVGVSDKCKCATCVCQDCEFFKVKDHLTATQQDCKCEECICVDCGLKKSQSKAEPGDLPIGQSRIISQKPSKAVDIKATPTAEVPDAGDFLPVNKLGCNCTPCECPFCGMKVGSKGAELQDKESKQVKVEDQRSRPVSAAGSRAAAECDSPCPGAKSEAIVGISHPLPPTASVALSTHTSQKEEGAVTDKIPTANVALSTPALQAGVSQTADSGVGGKLLQIPCDCPTCTCTPCADDDAEKKKPSEPVSKPILSEPSKQSAGVRPSGAGGEGPDYKKLSSDSLRKKIKSDFTESCECRKQIEEIRRALEQIKCACTEAETRTSTMGNAAHSVGQHMSHLTEPQSTLNKPLVKQASAFNQTMSGLKMALLNLQEKCKAKDKLIEAMTDELQLRASDSAFDKVIIATQAIREPIDYDIQEDNIKSFNAQMKDMQADVIFPVKEEREIATHPMESNYTARTVSTASKGVEVRTKPKKKRSGKPIKCCDPAKKDCACSKPQLVQTEDKHCQYIELGGFEIIDIRRITSDSIIIKWAPPSSKLVIGYDIFVNGVISSKVMSAARTSAMVHSLDLSRTVEITIYAVTRCGRCPPPAIAVYEVKQ